MVEIMAVICMIIGTACLVEARKADKLHQQYIGWGNDMLFETALEVADIGKEIDELKNDTKKNV